MIKKIAPIKVGERHQLVINDLNHQGEGVGRVSDFTIFVPHGLIGEQVEVEVTAVKKNYGVAKLLHLIKPIAARKEVECGHYHSCGGCQLLHLDYEAQLQWKKQLVENTIKRIGGIAPVVKEVLGMDNPYHYRNKVQLHCEKGALGYYRPKTRQLVPIDNCHLWPNSFAHVKRELEKALTQRGLIDIVKHLVLRQGDGDQVMAVIVTKDKKDSGKLRELAEQMVDKKVLTSCYQNINPKEGSLILGRDYVHLAGVERLVIKLGELEFFVSPAAFFQINTSQVRKLYQQVAQYAQLTGTETVLDAYCGTGTIGLYLADKAKKVVGIEEIPAAVKDARRNAYHNQLNNTEFITGKVEHQLPQMAQQGFQPEVVILDPPRAGCGQEVLTVITEIQPNRIIYVSCDPATLARDLKVLTGDGYTVEEVQPVDMFAQTGHVETVVLMSRVEK